MIERLSYSAGLRKTITWTGIATYIGLAVLAVLFYKERVAFVDLSFHLFTILQENNLTIQNFRFGAAITQLVPLVASRMGLGLQSVAVLYSLAFVGWYAFVFAFCVWVCRAERWAAVVLMLSTLMVTHTFYWAQSELQQGLAFMVLFLAIYQRWLSDKIPSWGTPVLVLGLVTVCFFHPIIFIPFSFCCAFFVLRNREGRISHIWLLVAFLVLTYIKNKVFHTAYDTENMKRNEQLLALFPNYFSTVSFRRFIGWLLHDYYVLVVGLLAVMGYYSWERSWLKLLLTGGGFLAFAVLVTASYPGGQEEQFYMENLLLPLTVFVAVPLAFDVLPGIPGRWAVAAVVLVVAMRVTSIGLAHSPYTNRIAWARRVMQRSEHLPNRKLIIPEQGIPMDTVMMAWGTPYEFWLLSSLEGNHQARSICVSPNPQEKEWALRKPQSFIATWGVFDYAQLPPRYFPFPAQDTTSYQQITYAELMKPTNP
ncbi:hypothetical protein HMJ29_08985 [Hymenobacter taeanensis]|uniref:Glycosyltransferase RgtA/B/C/D-like domain-containing protein n=1 Tax=Hymenobacter taeanensis TaxID=2735321 RepID=A0A6M6BGE4_9BACT|nr:MULTISPECIES: hypothetical protein [Hymenobacter]QJX47062.1 hypothetical protein HMJ29_08985 [Hymenobacter taeanensis]UOQ80940.1 hypothetical protein MUN83_19350 [Hymenobacter sp. 5414T-23]